MDQARCTAAAALLDALIVRDVKEWGFVQSHHLTDDSLVHIAMGVLGGPPAADINDSGLHLYGLYPFKREPVAKDRQGVTLREILAGLDRVAPAAHEVCIRWLNTPPYTSLYNDGATAAVLYAAYSSLDFETALRLSLAAVANPDKAKKLSTLLKGVGANATRLGAQLVELQTLVGRGVGDLDMESEAESRCGASAAKKAVKCDREALRSAIRRVLRDELPPHMFLERREQWWSRRWAWCANGAHGQFLDAEHGVFLKTIGVKHAKRRAAVEELRDDPGVPAACYFTGVVKQEHGKRRALFAGDTYSYLAYDRVLSKVEKMWRNKRVLLDPNCRGPQTVYEVIREVHQSPGLNVMLDYDDFNSQHTLDAMADIFYVLSEFFRNPEDRDEVRRLGDLFYHSYIRLSGRIVGKLGATLMSGHRATTFVNSVLNRAYLLVCGLGSEVSYHVGDDVLLSLPNQSAVRDFLGRIREAGLRINASKQSVGKHVEFLRTAYDGACYYMYLARRVSSLVSGNWIADRAQDAYERACGYCDACWTLAARGRGVSRVLSVAIQKRTGLEADVADGVCELKVVPEGTCVYTRLGEYGALVPTEEGVTVDDAVKGWHGYASREYIAKWSNKYDRELMRLAACAPVKDMALPAYGAGKVVVKGVKVVNQRAGGQRRRILPCLAEIAPVGSLVAHMVGGATLRNLLKRWGVALTAETQVLRVTGCIPPRVLALSKRSTAVSWAVPEQYHC